MLCSHQLSYIAPIKKWCHTNGGKHPLSTIIPCVNKYLRMKKLSPIAYRALFFKHVWRFLGNVTTARELQASHAIAVSGGLDSMTLLWVAKSLHEQGKIGPVRALFVHHHTRDGQNDEMEVIRKFCKQENIPFKALHVQGLNIHEGNFEARARSKRRELL